ncbi:MAG: 4-hydroxyphenylacetate 3-hydroxylase N-terminal domain-containing protein [Peptococcaceae bacterium]|jgi:4-hydroxyphenylacetate 3-monooxygenase/4-hydroxybutyryl-CoA dehydratase/vinylacetyl-CoA-Delta-isomerase|nr:aromatic ring hydroxylase [Peptococcaceae bacterium]MDH7525434.1 4-hydroxyphenylacetate 3-hydroxylase N-terminal domain-containing protein [Peptococcaceae bacterium]
MPVGTYEQYYNRLLKMKPNIYLGKEVVDRSDSRLAGGLYCMKQTFDCAYDERYRDVCTATSHLTGETINRFTHIHQSLDDLLKKQEMTKLLSHRVGGCIQRCMGIDALNALSVVTYEMDAELGTDYYQSFLKYLGWVQENDIVANCAQTDVKGNRTKRPHEQEDPDMYVRIIETRPDGIVVRGAKACNSAAPYVDEIIVLPTRFMGQKDNAYAVSFAVPADWPGVKLACIHGLRPRRGRIQAPVARVGDVESLTIFDDVFVPRERVFMDGLADSRVTPYAGFLALMFAHFHRHSYTGCKPAASEVLASQAALVAEYNGIEKEDHVREKICHIIGIAELVYAAGMASAYRAERSPSGTMIPDEILTNAGRKLAGEEIYNEARILADLAGGLIATLPLEDTFYAGDNVGELLHKYIMRNPKIPAENVHRCFRMIQDQIVSEFGSAQIVAGLHGGGSPQMEMVAMMSRYDLEELKGIAKYLAGIEDDIPIYRRKTVTPRKVLEKYRQMQGQNK